MNEIHASSRISEWADIETSSKGSRLIIGAESQIDSFVKFKMAGGFGDIHIGAHVYINSGCVLYAGNGIQIGDDVLIAANCTLAPVNHAYFSRNKLIRDQGFAPSKGGIIIENDVWIGANSVVLDGAHIEKGAVIGAGSVVSGRIERYSIYFGTPLRKVKTRED